MSRLVQKDFQEWQNEVEVFADVGELCHCRQKDSKGRLTVGNQKESRVRTKWQVF